MAYSAMYYTNQAAGLTDYVVNFSGPGPGYLSQSHVFLYINNIKQVGGFTWADESTIVLNTPTTQGDDIMLRRETSKDNPIVDFELTAVLTDTDLDISALQNLYISHEVLDGFIVLGAAGWVDANYRQIVNVADGVELSDAVNLDQLTTSVAASIATTVDLAAAVAEDAEAILALRPGYVLTVADLRDEIVLVGKLINTTGFSTVDDGGGTGYIGAAGAVGTYSDNGSSVIVPTGGDGSQAWIFFGTAKRSILAYGGIEAAVQDVGASIRTVLVDSAPVLSAPLVVPPNLKLEWLRNAVYTGGNKLTIHTLVADMVQLFDPAADIEFYETDVNNVVLRPEWFGVAVTSVDNTAAYQAMLAASGSAGLSVTFDQGTYLGSLQITKDNVTVFMDGVPEFKLPAGITGTEAHAPVSITGSGVSVHGDFICDGNGAFSSYSNTSKNSAALLVTGNDVSLYGNIIGRNTRGYGLAVWNGTSENTGTTPERFYLNTFSGINNMLYSVNMWAVTDFHVNKLYGERGALTSTDGRVRTGTQSSSSLACSHGVIDHIASGATIETNTKSVTILKMSGGLSKIEDANDIHVGSVQVQGESSASVYGFGIGSEFPAIGAKNITIGSILIQDSSVLRGVHVGGAGTENISINSLQVIDSVGYECDLSIREAKNMYINRAVLSNSGAASTGFLEENGYTRENVVINDLVTTGHSVSDIAMNSGSIVINSVNDDAVRLYQVVQADQRNIHRAKTFTVGATGYFASLREAIDRVSEKYRPTYFSRATYEAVPVVTLELQAGYVWDESIVLAGTDLSWIRIVPASGITTISGIDALVGGYSARLPLIEGDYNKDGSGGKLLSCSSGAIGKFSGTLINVINVPLYASKGGFIDCGGCVISKLTAATFPPTAIQAWYSGVINANSATVPYVETVGGGTVVLTNGAATGGLAQAANVLTASGIIYN